jgi:hypothetical protein
MPILRAAQHWLQSPDRELPDRKGESRGGGWSEKEGATWAAPQGSRLAA